LNSNRGQALIENVLLIPIIAIIVCMITFFSCIVLTKQQLIMAARYGTDLIVYTTLNEALIKKEIVEYLTARDNHGRRLNPDRLRCVIRQDTFPDVDRIGSLDKAWEAYHKLMTPTEHTSYVELYYDIPSPVLFSRWGNFLSGGTLPEKITVAARSEVLAGTGAQGK
jgi:hypothetical protein